jgi:uncharacterized protein YciW
VVDAPVLLQLFSCRPLPGNPAAHSESSLVNGIAILHELILLRRAATTSQSMAVAVTSAGYSAATYNAGLEPEQVSPEERERQKQILAATIDSILPKIDAFTQLLVNPPKKNPVRSTAGVLDPPLGATRLSEL